MIGACCITGWECPLLTNKDIKGPISFLICFFIPDLFC